MGSRGSVSVLLAVFLAVVWACGRSGVGVDLQAGSLVVTVEGLGRVVSDPAGIDCAPGSPTSDCSEQYEPGTTVILTATSSGEGAAFDAWSDCTEPSSATCSVTLDQGREVGASFLHRLRVIKSGPGYVTSGAGNIDCGADCEHWYGPSDTVLLAASTSSAETIDWSGSCASNQAGCAFSMDLPRNVRVGFYFPGDHVFARTFGGADQDQGNGITLDSAGNPVVTGDFRGDDVDLGSGAPFANEGNFAAFVAAYQAADGAHRWSFALDGDDDDRGNAIAADGNGGVVIAGDFQSTELEFAPDSTVSRVGGKDAFLARYVAETGAFSWVSDLADLPQGSDDGALAVFSQPTGDAYAGGHENGNGQNFMAFRVDPSGVVQPDPYLENVSGDQRLNAVAMLVDGTGTESEVVAGHHVGGLDISGLISVSGFGGEDLFISRTGTYAGVNTWATSVGTSGDDSITAVAVGPDGAIYAAGYFSAGTLTFESGEDVTSRGGKDAFLARFDPEDGTVDWVKGYGGGNEDRALGLAAGPDGLVLTGLFTNSGTPVQFGSFTLQGSGGANDLFVAKVSFDGTVLWAREFGGANDDSGKAVAVDAEGYSVVTGYVGSEVDFGGGLLGHGGGRDVFLLRLAP